ncbi:hypothetical protein ScalyP_jg1306 [Parmales sp. scaly parma]|nr:hypothetical protein ScalyP_jg1306 [Parmales sp. scaly parma]
MKLPTIIKALSLLSVVVADSSTKGPKGPKGLRSNKRSRSKTSEDFCPLDTTCLGPANTLGPNSLFSSCDSEICYPIVGYFAWAFGPSYPAPQVPTGTIGSQGPAGANVAISFSGLIDVLAAANLYVDPYSCSGTNAESFAPWGCDTTTSPGNAWGCPCLIGAARYLSVGGQAGAATFTVDAINKITGDIIAGVVGSKGYDGIVFDIESTAGTSAALIPAFNAAFAAAKGLAIPLVVVVTTSHSAPYDTRVTLNGTPDPSIASDLVVSWASSNDIDLFSPQLYTTGTVNESIQYFPTTDCGSGCDWSVWVGAKPTIVPAITKCYDKSATEAGLKTAGWTGMGEGAEEIQGYFQWAQEGPPLGTHIACP